MKTILIPTDFSDNAWRAAGYAVHLYRKVPCEFVIVHAFYEPSPAMEVIQVDAAAHISLMSKEIDIRMSKFETAFRELDIHPDSSIKKITRYGIASNVIKQQEKEQFADVIVMGTTGTSIEKRVALGSTAIAVVNASSCPVLCIPQNTELTPPKHIMFATDYRNLSNLDELLFLKEIAEQQSATLSIVNIKTNQPVPISVNDQSEGTVLQHFFGEIEQNYFEHEEEDIEMGILNFAEQKQADLIVTMKRDHTFWESIFHKSVTKGLGLHSHIPLLVIKDK